MVGQSKINERLHDMISNGILLEVSVLPKKNCKKKDTTSSLILIRLVN